MPAASRLLPRIVCCLALAIVATDAPAQNSTGQPRVINRQHEEWKTQADQAYRQRDYGKSIELTDRVLAANPNDDVALYLRGSARVEQGLQTGNAELVRSGIGDAREAIRIVNRVKIDYYLPYLFGMSQLSRMENKTSHAETARNVATQILGMNKVTAPEKATISYQRALLNIQLQDNEAALADFAKAAEYEPKFVAAYLSRCDLLARTGQPEQAEQAYADVVGKFPDDPLVWNNRGMYFQNYGRDEEAIADFTKAIEVNDKFPPAYTNRAFSRLRGGQFTAGLADLNTSIEIDPRQPAVYSLRGSAHLQTGDARAALTDYEAALQLDPQSPQLRADVGFAQFFANQYEPALRSFDAALEVDPQAKFLNPWRAAALVSAGRRADAEQQFAEVAAKPAAVRDWFDWLTLLVLGQVTDNEVLASISEGDAQTADAQRCEGFYFIGRRLLEAEKPEEAEPFFRQALESKSVHLSAYRAAQFALGEFGAKPQ